MSTAHGTCPRYPPHLTHELPPGRDVRAHVASAESVSWRAPASPAAGGLGAGRRAEAALKAKSGDIRPRLEPVQTRVAQTPSIQSLDQRRFRPDKERSKVVGQARGPAGFREEK